MVLLLTWKTKRQQSSQVQYSHTTAAIDIYILYASFPSHGSIFLSTIMFLYCVLNAERPGVVSIFLNQKHKLQTTRSWEFLGLERNGEIPADSIWVKARFGEDIIIGNIDTGNLDLLTSFEIW